MVHSIASHNENKAQTQASWSIDGLQRSLPSEPTPATRAIDVAKEAIEEKRLRGAIEEAERRMLSLDLGQPAASDMTTAKGTDQASKSRKQEPNRKRDNASSGEKERRRRRASSFLGWKEPVLRWLGG
jgi:hypothetical protein